MTRRPWSVLHILAPGEAGGLERVVQALATGHARRGHRVHVLAAVGPGGEDHPFVRSLRGSPVIVHALTLRARAYLGERRAVREICRREHVDIVHTHGYRPDVLDSGVARKLGIPTITTEHGISMMGGRTRLYEWLQRAAIRRFDRVVAVSRTIARKLTDLGVRADRVVVIPNAWHDVVQRDPRETARARLGISPGMPVVGWIGRLIAAKGADLFLQALARLRDGNYRAVIIGDGPERESLEALTAQLGLSDRVAFHGLIPDAASLMPAFDVFALTSRTEGTPIVLLEAMAAEVPLVVTMVGGVPDMVSEVEAATAAPEQPEALAEALRATLADPVRARARAQAARRRLQQDYQLDPWLDRYAETYSSMLAPAATR